MNRVKGRIKIALFFTFVGPWIGGMLFGLYLLAGRVAVKGIRAKYFFDLIELPFIGLVGILFIPPALLTGVVASLLIHRCGAASVLLISLFGTMFSYLYTFLLSHETRLDIKILCATIGFFASLACSLYIFRRD